MDPNVQERLKVKGYDTLDKLASAYFHMEGVLGSPNKVAIPDGDAGDDKWGQFYADIGRPEKADDYTFALPDGQAQATDGDKAFQSAMAPVLHEAGLSQRQVDAIAKGFNTYGQTLLEEDNARIAGENEEKELALKREWGGAYDAKLELGNAAIRMFGSEALVQELADSGFGRSPEMLKFAAKIGEKISGAGELVTGGGGNFVETPVAAQEEIRRIQSAAAEDPKHPYQDRSHPEHKALQERMLKLYQIAYPGQEAPA